LQRAIWKAGVIAIRSQLHLAGEPRIANDPYWVPGHVVHVSVGSNAGVVTISVEGADVGAGQVILERARAFAQPPGD